MAHDAPSSGVREEGGGGRFRQSYSSKDGPGYDISNNICLEEVILLR